MAWLLLYTGIAFIPGESGRAGPTGNILLLWKRERTVVKPHTVLHVSVWKGDSSASFILLAKVHHTSKPNIHGCVQERPHATESSSISSTDGAEGIQYTFTEDFDFSGILESTSMHFLILYSLGGYRWKSENTGQPLFMGQTLLTT